MARRLFAPILRRNKRRKKIRKTQQLVDTFEGCSRSSKKKYNGDEFVTNNMGRRKDDVDASTDVRDSLEKDFKRQKIDFSIENLRLLTSGTRDAEEDPKTWRELYLWAFQKTYSKRRVVHDVYSRSPDGRRDPCIYRCMGTNFGGSVFIIAMHDDHYHVVHDCSYSSNCCRCSRILKINDEFFRYKRRVVRSSLFELAHWENITEYFQRDRRQMGFLQLADRVWEDHSKDRHCPVRRRISAGNEQLV